MSTITVNSITKNFGTHRAVDEVSFEVQPGEIFGLLGPNGAGKTTSIRIILDIFKADSGEVAVFDGQMDDAKKNRIGYLPEERGLYQDIKLEYCLQYLASLKGLDKQTSQERITNYLKRFDLYEHRNKKIKELSKGMQQKAQLISALVHEPELIIIDEPFTALDPVNTQMVKDLLKEERANGKTIVMCTHQMHQVEELCDRLVLINQGKVVLYGNLADIQRAYAGNAVEIRTHQSLPAEIEGVSEIEHLNNNGNYLLTLAEGAAPQSVLQNLIQHEIILEQFEIAAPTLDELFTKIVTEQESGDEKHEYLRHVKRKRFIFSLLSVPFFVLVMVGVGFLTAFFSINDAPIGYIDQSGIFANPAMPEFERPMIFKDPMQIINYTSETEANQALDNEAIQAYFIIDENYMENAQIHAVANEAVDSDARRAMRQFLYLNLINEFP